MRSGKRRLRFALDLSDDAREKVASLAGATHAEQTMFLERMCEAAVKTEHWVRLESKSKLEAQARRSSLDFVLKTLLPQISSLGIGVPTRDEEAK